MPNVSVTLPETSQSVTRPIVFDIISQVQAITKIDKNVKIFFPGDSEKMQQPGSGIDNLNRDAFLANDRYLFIEIEEDFDINAVGTTAVTRSEHPPVFNDMRIGVMMTPVYATTDIVINFKYRTQSKTEAFRWRDDIRMRVSQMRDVNIHDVTYHYGLPNPYLQLLGAIYDCRENIAGYHDTFQEYVTSNASNRLTLISDLANKDNRLVISETQSRITGIFGFDTLPEKPEHNSDIGTWTVSFSYKFSFEKPIACNLRYPVMVHNQLLPEKYVLFNNTSQDLDNTVQSFSQSIEAMNYFETQLQVEKHLDPHSVIYLPECDDFTPRSEPPGTGSVFYALCSIDEETKKELLNLKDIDPIFIDRDIMEFMVNSETPYMTQLYKSIIQVHLYRNDHMTSDGTIKITPDMQITALKELDLRDVHHIRLSIVSDLTRLDTRAIDRLRKYPKALFKLIGAINEIIRNNPGLENISSRPSVSLYDFSMLYRFLTGFEYAGEKNTSGRVYNPSIMSGYNAMSGYQVGGINHRLDPFRDVRGPNFDSFKNNRIQDNKIQVTSIIAFENNI